MGNYKESQLTVTPFTRARQIIINNPYNGNPSIEYKEERILEVEKQVISRDMGTLSVPVLLDRVIPIRNPETGELTGDNIPMTNAYAIIYSAYWQDALLRDIVPIEIPIEEVIQ